MRIGFIGAGSVTRSIGHEAIRAGHEIVIASRSETSVADAVEQLGHSASGGSLENVANADLIVLAVPWLQVQAALSAVPDWTGRILVDATNPFTQISPTMVLEDLGGRSASDVVASFAPGARVVKAFNSITMETFDKGAEASGGTRVLFVSGGDHEAKSAVRSLIESFGFASIDLGDLTAGGLQQQAGGPLAGVDLLISG